MVTWKVNLSTFLDFKVRFLYMTLLPCWWSCQFAAMRMLHSLLTKLNQLLSCRKPNHFNFDQNCTKEHLHLWHKIVSLNTSYGIHSFHNGLVWLRAIFSPSTCLHTKSCCLSTYAAWKTFTVFSDTKSIHVLWLGCEPYIVGSLLLCTKRHYIILVLFEQAMYSIRSKF